MIGKVITGRSFGGCIRYVVQKHEAVILDAAGVRIPQVSQIISDFNLQRKYNPGLGKAVGHIALSWSINDAAGLTDETMVNIAKEYLQKMKIQDTQYLIVRHRDKDHPHIHIVYNRVNNNGKTISDNFQKQRNVQAAKELTLKHGFYMSPGKAEVNRQQLKGRDKIRYELFDAIKAAVKKVKNTDELKHALAKQGIVTHLKYRSGTGEVQGISFSKGDHKFKGSEIDRSLSYSKLMQEIEQQQLKPEKSLADQLREVIQNKEQERMASNEEQPGAYPQTEFQGGISERAFKPGLHNGDTGFGISIADDADDEAVHGRNRQRKKQGPARSR